MRSYSHKSYWRTRSLSQYSRNISKLSKYDCWSL